MTIDIRGWLAGVAGADRLDCELLLCRHLELDRIQIIAAPDRRIPDAKLDKLNADLRDMAAALAAKQTPVGGGQRCQSEAQEKDG